MVWIAFCTAIVGLGYRTICLVRMTAAKKALRFDDAGRSVRGKRSRAGTGRENKPMGSLFKSHPAMATLTWIFHICLIATPFFVLGHGVLFGEAWSLFPPSLPGAVTHSLTMIFLISAVALLIRRLAAAHVRAVSTFYDVVLLLIVIAPFFTGFLAYKQLVDYRPAIIAHMISGELMLIALGVTKLGHMVLFFFVRFFIGSEYSFGPGTRRWQTK